MTATTTLCRNCWRETPEDEMTWSVEFCDACYESDDPHMVAERNGDDLNAGPDPDEDD